MEFVNKAKTGSQWKAIEDFHTAQHMTELLNGLFLTDCQKMKAFEMTWSSHFEANLISSQMGILQTNVNISNVDSKELKNL